MEKKYIVRNSKIHGNGVFAKRDIKKGEEVIEYKGKKLTKKESDDIAERTLEMAKSNKNLGQVYIFEINKKYDIDGNVSYNPARFINHSCTPNCETQQDDEDRIWIVAVKEIKKGEEITYNYGYDFENYKEHRCKCSSRNCVGYILDEKHWKKLPNMKRKK